MVARGKRGTSVVRALLWQHLFGVAWSSWSLAALAVVVSARSKVISPPLWLDLVVLCLAMACGYMVGLWVSLDTDTPDMEDADGVVEKDRAR